MEYKKILIIEDEIPIADLLAYGLKKAGFDCRTSNNGAEGLNLVEEFNPDLLLLDWMLPDVSGIDICKLVTEKNNIPIIMSCTKNQYKTITIEENNQEKDIAISDEKKSMFEINKIYKYDNLELNENQLYLVQQ